MYNEGRTVRYVLVEDVVTSEGNMCRSYGIATVQTESDGKCREEYRDIGTDRSAVNALVQRCNDLGLDPIHLKDVVEDFMISV